MSVSLKMVFGSILFYIILFIVFGLIGQEQLISEIEINTSTSIIGDLNTSSEIGITEMPGFVRSVSFVISGMPWWVNSLMTLPSILIILGIVWFLRGI